MSEECKCKEGSCNKNTKILKVDEFDPVIYALVCKSKGHAFEKQIDMSDFVCIQCGMIKSMKVIE